MYFQQMMMLKKKDIHPENSLLCGSFYETCLFANKNIIKFNKLCEIIISLVQVLPAEIFIIF